MNERIQQLAKQAERETKEHFNSNWDGTPREIFDMYFNEKFAELIIRDCANLAKHHVMNISTYADAEFVEEQIEQHFGVK